jgi:hypothetical protein
MIRFNKFGFKYLDFEFSATSEAKIRIIERPGLWMAPEALAQILADVRTVIYSSLRQELRYGFLSGEKHFLNRAIIALLYEKKNGRPIAFNAMSLMDIELNGRRVPVLHVGLVMVVPEYRHYGLTRILAGANCALVLVRNCLRPLWISNVTQVPSAVGMTIDGFANVFPRPDRQSPPGVSHLLVAGEIMRKHRGVFGVGEDASFDTERFVISNAYTGGSDNLKKRFSEAPKHRDEEVNQMCCERLNFERGDDFLMIGVLTIGVILNHLFRSLIRPPASATIRGPAFVQSLLTPIIHRLASITRQI